MALTPAVAWNPLVTPYDVNDICTLMYNGVNPSHELALPTEAFKLFGKKTKVFNIIYSLYESTHPVKFHVRQRGRNRNRVYSLSTGFAELAAHVGLDPDEWIAFARVDNGPPDEAIVKVFKYSRAPVFRTQFYGSFR